MLGKKRTSIRFSDGFFSQCCWQLQERRRSAIQGLYCPLGGLIRMLSLW
jgi:hypothetical protein